MSFRKAYIETNAINQAYKCAISGFRLGEVLDSKGLSPAVGMHVVYELARTFLNEADKKTGTDLFSILQDLDPFYQPAPKMLHDLEIIKLRTGAAVLPVLDPLDLAAIKQEVGRLALGFFDDNARNFIQRLEEDIKESHPKLALDYIAQV